ncbi:unnamed protein product [Penicillium salamii]|uniref:Uncharacterized protein n=1 Tax=Penicillium salamii TaxID=1612424 RepID=A0A9W4J4S7_9EURO|nr:unnamed protein product [Penicillium salamii]CAG8096710.1 unnamed protein product [Penicillium salamii]CAG8187309.1 unnamed protein product [Penicillium salamii]CAG8189444.1 unnamed protein product [Penicillium salamii]CAG8248709.1 unnamed protein product [Penicillium salamii]
MDSTLQPAFNSQAPQTSSLQPSKLESTMAAQAQNTIEVASNATRQVFASPLQNACSPSQPLSKAISQNQSAPTANPHTMPLNQAPAQNNPLPHIELGGPTATAPFLQDFSLVAEAAKRAQMGIVMRDLESVTL